MYHLIVLFIFVISLDYVILLNKCCDTETFLKKLNSTYYFCDEDTDKRLQIYAKESNYYLKRNETSMFSCYDTNNAENITEYTISGLNVIKAKQIQYNFYTKCCPLGFFYNSTIHACAKGENLDERFITKHFIKVGLPNCKLIKDYKLDSTSKLGYRLELGALFIGNGLIFREGDFCVDKDENGDFVARTCHKNLKEVCEGIRCVRKCCPDGQSFVNGRQCLNTYTHGVDLGFNNRANNSADPFAIIHNYECEKIYILKDNMQYYLDEKGVFWAFYNVTQSFKRFDLDMKSYCIEHVTMKNMDGYKFFMCFPEVDTNAKFFVTRWLKIASIIFLILTISAYIFLPEMMNLFAKILMNFCSAVILLFSILAWGQFELLQMRGNCIWFSFIASFGSIAAFTWLNVMCFHTWYTLGSMKTIMVNQKRSELKKLLFYCLYGWGFPIIWTLITWLTYFYDGTPKIIKPTLGSFKCFWHKVVGNHSTLLFYALPLFVIEMSNTILFIKTIMYCARVKSEINRMNDNRRSVKERKKIFNADKEQLILVLKLSVTMGILFVFEVFSTLYNISLNRNVVLKYVEIIWDAINCMQGIFIFIIFVCKRNVWRQFKKKFLHERERKISTSMSTQVIPLNSIKP